MEGFFHQSVMESPSKTNWIFSATCAAAALSEFTRSSHSRRGAGKTALFTPAGGVSGDGIGIGAGRSAPRRAVKGRRMERRAMGAERAFMED